MNLLSFQTILSSIHNNEKSYIYEVLQPWLGTGLLTSGGNVIIHI